MSNIVYYPVYFYPVPYYQLRDAHEEYRPNGYFINHSTNLLNWGSEKVDQSFYQHGKSIGKDFNLDFKPANTGDELIKLVNSNAKTLVRNFQDYKKVKNQLPFLKNLNPEIINRFEESLVFNNGGYASSYYGDLAQVLSFRDFSQLYALFGLSMKYFYDTAGYQCDDCVGGGKECESNSNYSCASTCGSCD